MADDERQGRAGSPDAYEKQFMTGEGKLLHRERQVWRFHWLLLFGPLMMAVTGGMGLAGLGSKPMPIPVALAMFPLAALMLGLWVAFISLRTTVTEREVLIQYGLFGPRIPIEGITSCVAKDYPVLAFGGGIKYVDGAWAYTLFGQGTRVVRIEWRDAAGKAHATMVSSPDPDALAAVINTARGSAATGARVAIDTKEAQDEAEEEEVEEEKRQRRE